MPPVVQFGVTAVDAFKRGGRGRQWHELHALPTQVGVDADTNAPVVFVRAGLNFAWPARGASIRWATWCGGDAEVYVQRNTLHQRQIPLFKAAGPPIDTLRPPAPGTIVQLWCRGENVAYIVERDKSVGEQVGEAFSKITTLGLATVQAAGGNFAPAANLFGELTGFGAPAGFAGFAGFGSSTGFAGLETLASDPLGALTGAFRSASRRAQGALAGQLGSNVLPGRTLGADPLDTIKGFLP